MGEIKVHPFFIGINWKKIREQKAPFIPDVNFLSKLKFDYDTSNFDKYDEDENWVWHQVDQSKPRINTKKVKF